MIRLISLHFNKRLILFLAILLSIVAVYVYINMFRGITMSPDIIHIQSSEIVDGGLVLNGTTASSANGFKDYSFEVQDEKLMLKVRYVPIVNHWYPSGEFHIQLSKQELVGIREVYLYKNGDNKRLLWSQIEGISGQ